MAIIIGGVTGRVTQKLGSVVFSSWRGRNVVKTLNPSPRNPNTEAQQAQRSVFALVVGFLRVMVASIRIGFKNFNIIITQFNNAMSYNVKVMKDAGFSTLLEARSLFLIARGNLLVSGEIIINLASSSTFDLEFDGFKADEYNSVRTVIYNFDTETSSQTTTVIPQGSESVAVAIPAPFGTALGHQAQVFMFGYNSITGNSMDSISSPTVIA